MGGILSTVLSGRAPAIEPDHPIITEVYNDPAGPNDGPVGRDASNPHQEFIEIYLPPAGALSPSLNKDSLKLTFYEVEGDSSSSGPGLVNYRFDLPPLDLDPTNGLTPGAVARPASGVILLGWIDYTGDPPIDLAGTLSTRVALIDGGVTVSPAGALFIAINGNQFSGTTNFPSVAAESLIDVPSETLSGIIQNGSAAYLLVDRDAAGYMELYDDQHVPPGGSADPALAGGTVLQTSCLLDGFAGNDDSNFDVSQQPYSAPTGNDIDLEAVLPAGGAFSLLVAQVPEEDGPPMPGTGSGYARRFVDVPRTTEDAVADDPVADALNAYRRDRNTGPFLPTPGRVVFTTSPAELGVATDSELIFDVLAGTTGRAGVLCANTGGNHSIDITAMPGASGNPGAVTFAAGEPAHDVAGQTFSLPAIAITATVSAAHGATASASLTVTAVNSTGVAPAVLNPTQNRTVTARVLNPSAGLDAAGQPFQATVFLAVQGVPSNLAVANELTATSLGTYLVSRFGGAVPDSLGNGDLLLDAGTNIADPLIVQPIIEDFPDTPDLYIDVPGAPGKPSLAQTVLSSAEVQAGATSYDGSFNDTNTAIKAIHLNVPNTRTYGGAFAPSEFVNFADDRGDIADPRSGLTRATPSRTFELVLVDANVTDAGLLETGETDDFGIVVQVADTEPGSPVVKGEYIFLSFMGGLQGMDIDSLYVPPGDMVANLIYLDLDNLHNVLGVRSIGSIYVVDASGNGQADIIEAFSLTPAVPGDSDLDGDLDQTDFAVLQRCYSGPDVPAVAGCSSARMDADSDVDPDDVLLFEQCAGGPSVPADTGCAG